MSENSGQKPSINNSLIPPVVLIPVILIFISFIGAYAASNFFNEDSEIPQLSAVANQHSALNKLDINSIDWVYNAANQQWSFELCSTKCLGPYRISKDGYFYFKANRNEAGDWVVTAEDDLKTLHSPDKAALILDEMLDKLTSRYVDSMNNISAWNTATP